jgi:hypothetical protein
LAMERLAVNRFSDTPVSRVRHSLPGASRSVSFAAAERRWHQF